MCTLLLVITVADLEYSLVFYLVNKVHRLLLKLSAKPRFDSVIKLEKPCHCSQCISPGYYKVSLNIVDNV